MLSVMAIIIELIIVFAVLHAGSFLLFYLVIKQDDPAVRAMVIKEQQVKGKARDELVKSVKKAHKGSGLLTAKWVEFGGGFYGLVAVLTYFIVEAQEIIELFSSENGVMDTISHIGIGTLVNFFIESILNFITAISWPIYWMGEGQAAFWQWFLVAYAGYLAGQIHAKSFLKRQAQ